MGAQSCCLWISHYYEEDHIHAVCFCQYCHRAGTLLSITQRGTPKIFSCYWQRLMHSSVNLKNLGASITRSPNVINGLNRRDKLLRNVIFKHLWGQ